MQNTAQNSVQNNPTHTGSFTSPDASNAASNATLRRIKHGRIRPMEEPSLIARLLARTFTPRA